MSQMIKKLDDATKTHLHNLMQLAVFKLNDDNYYGINVAKIRAFEDFKRFKMTKGTTQETQILDGYLQYRDKVIPVLNVEKWLGVYEKDNTYNEYIVCEFNKETVALPIADINNIYNIEVESLQKPEMMKDVVTYNSILNIDDEETICLILDVEKLLADAFGLDFDFKLDDYQIKSNKELLIAEDSKVATEIFREIFKHKDIKYKIFEDGEQIIDYLKSLDEGEIDSIGMIITDIEMPKKDGYQVIKEIKSDKKLSAIPVAINTSMSNEGVKKKAMQLGVCTAIAKTDPKAVMSALQEYMRV
ncbi:MAG: chemotaxis protein CheV [Campylobacterales bacterium]